MKEMEPFKLLVSQHEAEKLVLKNCRPLDVIEEVPISAASGRVLASDIKADRSVPPFNRSAMDGYAVIAEDTFGADEGGVQLKLKGVIHAGDVSSEAVTQGHCIQIATGSPLPKGADAVVMVEYTENAACFTDPQGCVWIEMPLQETGRTGYKAETISAMDPNATCVRIRRRPTSTTHFNPADTISAAIDVIIPDNISLEGKRLYNRALAGASKLFGGASDLSPIETINVRTIVSSEISVSMEKGLIVPSLKKASSKKSNSPHARSAPL